MARQPTKARAGVTVAGTGTKTGSSVTHTGTGALVVVASVTGGNSATPNIPSRKFIGVVPANHGQGISTIRGLKHTTARWHPPSKRFYFNGGDYDDNSGGQSYRQWTFALDPVAALNAPATVNAGWTTEYPRDGFGGSTVQPKRPDYTGFEWDSSRNVFWFTPGTMVPSTSDNSPGETPNFSSDPNFVYLEVMQFKPTNAPAARWLRPGVGRAPDVSGDYSWMAVLDPVRDKILQPCYNSGTNAFMDVLDLPTLTWTTGATYFGQQYNGGDLQVAKDYLSTDYVARLIYAMNGRTSDLHTFTLDSPYTHVERGPIPLGSANGTDNYTFHVFDSVNKVLIWFRSHWSGGDFNMEVFAYLPDRYAWEQMPNVTDQPSQPIAFTDCCAFSADYNMTVALGSTVESQGIGSNVYNQFVWFYRYAPLRPAWLSGQALNTWIDIPNTALQNFGDFQAQKNAGLTDALGNDIGYGKPRFGIMAFSGGTIKTTTSEMLLFGGGGQDYAGNEVRSLALALDNPTWSTPVLPTNVSQVRPRGNPTAAALNLDGTTPTSNHSYQCPVFLHGNDKFCAFGTGNVWFPDNGHFENVFSVQLGNAWDAPGTITALPAHRQADAFLIAKDPVQEDVFYGCQNSIYKWTRHLGTWAQVVFNGGIVFERCIGCIRPTDGLMFGIGWLAQNGAHFAYNIRTGAFNALTLTGTYASLLSQIDTSALGFVYDPLLDKWLIYRDFDATIYTATLTSSTTMQIEKLIVAGTSPIAGNGEAQHGQGVSGRFQYVPAMKGVCLIQAANVNAKFIQTA